MPLSDSEAHRALRTVPEETPVLIRYNPHNPDQVHTLPSDNEEFPFKIWPLLITACAAGTATAESPNHRNTVVPSASYE